MHQVVAIVDSESCLRLVETNFSESEHQSLSNSVHDGYVVDVVGSVFL